MWIRTKTLINHGFRVVIYLDRHSDETGSVHQLFQVIRILILQEPIRSPTNRHYIVGAVGV